MSLCRLTIHELLEMLGKGQISAVDLTRDVLARISEIDDRCDGLHPAMP